MRSYGLMLTLLTVLCVPESALLQDQGSAIIQGAVYDLYDAVIPNVGISIENTKTGDATSVRTDESGQYRAAVHAGRYRVIMRPSVGYPIGYEHSSFAIASGQNITINFRPKPFSISSSISAGKWEERYVGTLPSAATHFVQLRDGTIRELQIQYQHVRINNNAIQYTDSVIASFDRFTIYADRITFFPQRRRLLAEGNVMFEDGERAHKTTRTDLDLLATPH